jgi:hypothetical protein
MATTIIARMFGGLGNQLFIYASARGFAARWGRKLYLDVYSGYRQDPYGRSFRLDAFNISARAAPKSACFQYAGGSVMRFARRVVAKHLPVSKRNFLCERDLSPSQLTELSFSSKVIYLEGYWQRHSYFEHVERELREELTLREPLAQQTMALGSRVASECSVAVHLRGLHGVSATGSTIAEYPQLPLEYYRRALHLMQSQLVSPRFLFFTDGADADPLVRMCDKGSVITDERKDRMDHEDFWLMSECKHHVIANSTFSWWAAWRQTGANHRVVTPRMDRYGQTMTTPAGWTIVDV